MSVYLTKLWNCILNFGKFYFMQLFLNKAVFKTSIWDLIVLVCLLKLASECFTNWNCDNLLSISVVSCFSFIKTSNDNLWVFGHVFHTPFGVLNFSCMYRGWLERESRYGLQPGHNWFIISMQWWQQWKEYVKYVSKSPVNWHFSYNFQLHQTLCDYWPVVKCSKPR